MRARMLIDAWFHSSSKHGVDRSVEINLAGRLRQGARGRFNFREMRSTVDSRAESSALDRAASLVESRKRCAGQV